MVAAVDRRLNGEDVRGVAQVGLQRCRHLRQRCEHVREGGLVGLDDRVLGVHVVEGHLARVGVDDHFHRVPHVVVARREAAADRHLLAVGVLGVRVVGRGGVAVHHPVDVPVVDHGIGIRVEAQERRRLLGHGHGVAHEHDPGLVGDLARNQQVQVAQTQREGGPLEERRQLHPARARVVALDARVVRGLVVHLELLAVGHDVARLAEPEVDPRLFDLGQSGRRRRRHPLDAVDRVVRLGLVGQGDDRAVAVGVLQVGVDPGLRRQVAADLAGADQDRRELVVDGVAVHPDGRERVVREDPLLTLEGLQRNRRVGVPLADVGDGRGRAARPGSP